MATTYKVLGQSNPAATTLTTLYTVPSATEAVVSTISVANISASAITYRIAIRPDGASIANSQYLVYDASLAANSTTAYTLGITLDATDVISVYASDTNGVFQAFGSEIA
jgi:hypothetical protein